jgi:hypothetical protein
MRQVRAGKPANFAAEAELYCQNDDCQFIRHSQVNVSATHCCWRCQQIDLGIELGPPFHGKKCESISAIFGSSGLSPLLGSQETTSTGPSAEVMPSDPTEPAAAFSL